MALSGIRNRPGLKRSRHNRGAGFRFSLCPNDNMSADRCVGVRHTMSSVHEGVSCDGCMAPNFAGDRYKCLRCYDFDLCSRCYAEERTAATGSSSTTTENRTFREPNEEHSPSHPMQCIMTQQDFELAYQGDQTHSWDRLRVVIFTCPVCGLQGFSRERLVSHVIEDHANQPRSPTQRFEMACPICISTDFYRIGFGDYMPNHLTDMVAHMQEHHMQAQYTSGPSNSANTTSETAHVLSEYLRDRDLRRVIVHNVPLVGNESDVEEPDGSRRAANNQRSGPQRIETVSRIRRRPADRSAPEINQSEETGVTVQQLGSFVPGRVEEQVPAGFSPRRPTIPHPGLSSGFSGRSNVQQSGIFFSSLRSSASRAPLQPERTARDTAGLGYSGNSSIPVGSITETPLSPYDPQSELLTDSSTAVRTFQYPITAYSRPSIPSFVDHGAQRNQRDSSENTSRTMGYARRLLVRERDQMRNEASLDAPPGFRRPENAETSNATGGSGASPARVAASSARSRNTNTTAHSSISDTVEPPTSNADSHVLIDLGVNDDVVPNSTQESAVEEIAERSASQTEQSSNTESKKSLKYCTLFTAVAKPSCLPVLKIERMRRKNDEGTGQLDMSSIDDIDDSENSDEIPPFRLIMRIGRPLRSTYAQRNRRSAQQQPYDASDDIVDWWSSQLNEHLRTESAVRASQTNVESVREAPITQPTLDRSVVSHGEVALNRAVEALRRLDARNTHSNRSPMPHDGITQTNNPAYLNGNIIPPPGIGSRHAQVLPSALGSTLFLGSDSVAEAVAREVAAFSEASGLNIRQLQGLIRREEHVPSSSHLPPNPHLSSRTTRFSSIPAPSSVSDTRTRKSVKLQTRENEQHGDEYNDFINDTFKAPEIDSALDAKCIMKKRIYKPYDLKTNEQKEMVLIPWLEEQNMLDLSVNISDTQLDDEITELLRQIPEFADDELIIAEKTVKNEYIVETGSDAEEAMFDSGKGSDDELLIKKCESADLKQPQGAFIVLGIFGTYAKEQNEFEVDYWKDYRFLRNRRDAFILKKSIDVPPEFLLGPLDYRLMKQLVFGKLDVEISLYGRVHYLPEIFLRILRTNLRTFHFSQESKEFLEENVEEIMLPLECVDSVQWDTRVVKAERSGMKKPLEIFPELWYFLDLASFFEPK